MYMTTSMLILCIKNQTLYNNAIHSVICKGLKFYSHVRQHIISIIAEIWDNETS